MLDAGVRDVRNQGVLMRGVNDNQQRCSTSASRSSMKPASCPYYFYMCDMIPNAEHWRVAAVARHRNCSTQIMGYLPGFATPRIVCDVPYLGKRWVDQVAELRPQRGISQLDQELPHQYRGRRPGRASPALRVLRPDPDALGFRPDLVAAPRAGRSRCRCGLVDGHRAAAGIGPEGSGAVSTHDTERRRPGRVADVFEHEAATPPGRYPPCLHEIFERQADTTPDATAVVCGSRGLTYAELDAAANRLARRLRLSGARPGTFVGILANRSELPIIGILACLKAGAAYVPIDPGYPTDRVRHIAAELDLRLCLTDTDLYPRAAEMLGPDRAFPIDDSARRTDTPSSRMTRTERVRRRLTCVTSSTPRARPGGRRA